MRRIYDNKTSIDMFRRKENARQRAAGRFLGARGQNEAETVNEYVMPGS